jgi:hypothetical protein
MSIKKTYVKTLLRIGALLVVAVTGANVAQAQTCSVNWTNNTDDYLWSTAGNWSTNQVPGPTDDVCIPNVNGGFSDARGVSSTISIHSLQISQNGLVDFGSGTVLIATPVTLPGAITLFGTTLSVSSVNVPPGTGGGLGGYGTIEGSVTNSGDFEATATLTITGDYTQTSSGRIDATWPGFGLEPPYGLIQVEGNVTLSGTLSVRTDVPKFPPKNGSTFTVMTFGGSLNGEFTEVLPTTVTAKYEKNSVLGQYH